MLFSLCFEHILLIAKKDQKQVFTTLYLFSLTILVTIYIIDMHINLEQRKIYYNIDIHKDKYLESQKL